MTYEQTLEHLYAQLPMFSRIGAAAYKADLHNTIALCNAMGNPEKKFRSIHVAGTNGKGSTSHMLAAILQKAGYKTGLYTSPHLKDFGERIKINGEMIDRDFVIDFVERSKVVTESVQPSFFELTVVMAFDYFARENVDIAVIETGLGGRLDSTNVITPVLSVITNIGYDHMNLLGNTLEKIAYEKAGIIKENVPVVIGEYLPETKPVFMQKAAAMQAPIYFAQEMYAVSDTAYSLQSLSCKVEDTANHITEDFTLDLNGLYQTKNLKTVLCAEGILMEAGFTITNAAEKYALGHVKELTGLHGRWEVVAQQPAIVLDVAHNEDGIKQVLQQLPVTGHTAANTHFVMGMVSDKDVDKVLSLLPQGAHYYFTNARIPRAMPHAALQEKAKSYGLQGNGFDDVNEAIKHAKANAAGGDIIVVCGSVFVVSEVEPQLFS